MGCKVIVAEDDFVVGRVIHATLEAAGHEVLAVVPTGEEALILALSAEPDVVIMDVGLAGKMDGIEAAQRLRGRSGCAVVFHTAHSDADHRARMLAVRNAAIVQKSGRVARLVEAVSRSPGAAH